MYLGIEVKAAWNVKSRCMSKRMIVGWVNKRTAVGCRSNKGGRGGGVTVSSEASCTSKQMSIEF